MNLVHLARQNSTNASPINSLWASFADSRTVGTSWFFTEILKRLPGWGLITSTITGVACQEYSSVKLPSIFPKGPCRSRRHRKVVGFGVLGLICTAPSRLNPVTCVPSIQKSARACAHTHTANHIILSMLRLSEFKEKLLMTSLDKGTAVTRDYFVTVDFWRIGLDGRNSPHLKLPSESSSPMSLNSLCASAQMYAI